MAESYYEKKDLADFSNISEFAPEIGITNDEMMEAIHVGASMMAGITLAHSTQVRKIAKKKEM